MKKGNKKKDETAIEALQEKVRSLRRLNILLCVIAALLCIAIIAVYQSGGIDASPVYDSCTDDELAQALAALDGVAKSRQTIAKSALSLVGKVDYFWGGKSEAVGFDNGWGTPRLVESEGSSTTGTLQPYGLDCSGYIAWCFLQTGLSVKDVKRELGFGTKKQYFAATEIEWDALRVGDLAFQYTPFAGTGNHVGICVGFLPDGSPLFAHCSFAFGGVVVTGRGNVFNYPRRPDIYKLLDDGNA